MATKNQIAHRLWIIQAIRIPCVKSSKQNCLECSWSGRVGVVRVVCTMIVIVKNCIAKEGVNFG
jgi:hypothetical protein